LLNEVGSLFWYFEVSVRYYRKKFTSAISSPDELLYYHIVTCLLVTCAAAADVGLHVDATACCCFPVKTSFSDVIMNEHLKLKTVNEDTVWGGVSYGEGTRPVPKTGKRCQFYAPKYSALSIMISDCCLLKFGFT